MRWMGITILAMLLMLASCGGGADTVLQPAAYSLLEDTQHEQVSLRQTGSALELELRPGSRGVFLELDPGFDARYATEHWQDAEETLHLMACDRGRLQLGVVPLPAYAGETVRLRIERGSVDRTASQPPLGNANRVSDLQATDLGDGTVRLEWTQVNTGDYNHDGLVSVSDITPLGQNFARSGPWQPSEPEFWVDGDRNGVINISDITPIAVNFSHQISGYNIYRVGGSNPPADGLLQSVPDSAATKPNKLPRRYSVLVNCPPDGTFTVRPVDNLGEEGVESDPFFLSSLPAVQLNLDITGQMLYDQQSGLPSAFSNDTVILRIIDDIEEVNGVEIGGISPLAEGQFAVSGLPREQALFLQIAYQPVVDLSSGAPKSVSLKSGSSLRGVSEIPEGAEVTSIPFRLPAGDEPITLDTLISLGTANPDGGFFVELEDSQSIPGDNPATPAVEDGYTIVRDLQLDHLNGLLSGDSDGNGSFEMEPRLVDMDRDCLSPKRGEQVLDDDDEYENREELEIEGTVTGFDQSNGIIFLTDAEIEIGDMEFDLPSDVIVYITEFTYFEERLRDDPDIDDRYPIDPDAILAGDILKIDLYALEDSAELLPTKYWVEKVQRFIDLRD